jgi:serine protease Do
MIGRFARARSVVPLAAALLLGAVLAARAQSELGAVNDELLFGRRSALVRAAEKAGPAVVTVSVLRTQIVEGPAFAPNREFFNPFFQNLRRRYWQRVQGVGSGVIVREDGVILPNFHVVKSAEEIRITLADGREYAGQFIGGTELYDLAVVKASIGKDKIPVASFDRSAGVVIGEWAMAIGNPFGGRSARWHQRICETQRRIYRKYRADTPRSPHFGGGLYALFG